MDPMQPLQQPSTMPAPGGKLPTGGGLNWLPIVAGLLALSTVGLGIAAATAFTQAKTATTTLETQKKAAADAARSDQKKQDATAAEIAAESPFRSYVAPLEYGSFEIKFPKNWSGYVEQTRSGTTQVNLVLNPDFVRKDNNVEDLQATKVILMQRTLEEYLKPYTNVKGLDKADVTVAGIKSVQLSGKIPDRRSSRIVAVPVRDKTILFVNENSKYSREFDQILAQSKIVP